MFNETNQGIGVSNPQAKLPTAHITRTQDKSRGRFKIYQDKIYLDNKEEFEIELFNPSQENIIARIEINGIMISDSGIVLKPAQRLFLERYFDNNKRFKFDVYSIESVNDLREKKDMTSIIGVNVKTELETRTQLNNFLDGKELEDNKKLIEELKKRVEETENLEIDLTNRANDVEQASKNNGHLTVYFYKEKKEVLLKGNVDLTYRESNIIYGNDTSLFNYYDNNSPQTTLYNQINNINTSNGTIDVNCSLNSDYNTTCSTNINSFCPTNKDEEITEEEQFANSFFEQEKSVDLNDVFNQTKEVDTGRVEQGRESNQKFVETDMLFETYPFHSISYKLLPISDKPNEVSDLRKYCTSCGAKLKKNDNFCSKCGTRS